MIVVGVIGVLAAIPVPMYLSQIQKARRAEALVTLKLIREAIVGYQALRDLRLEPNSFPINITVDNNTVLNIERPVTANFTYSYDANNCIATTLSGQVAYTMNIATGAVSP